MPYDPFKHHRRSIRLKDYDYAQEGTYFVTICSHQRECLFGDVENDSIILTPYGEIVLNEWLQLPKYGPYLDLDAFIIMPNHVHGIVVLNRSDTKHVPLGNIIRRFKGFTAREINSKRGTPGNPVWQRDFYEKIIRSEPMLDAIRGYIENNPLNWAKDDDNPARMA